MNTKYEIIKLMSSDQIDISESEHEVDYFHLLRIF